MKTETRKEEKNNNQKKIQKIYRICKCNVTYVEIINKIGNATSFK